LATLPLLPLVPLLLLLLPVLLLLPAAGLLAAPLPLPLPLPLPGLVLVLPALEHFPGQFPSTLRLSVLERRVDPGVGVLPFAEVTLIVTCVLAAAGSSTCTGEQYTHCVNTHSSTCEQQYMPRSTRHEPPYSSSLGVFRAAALKATVLASIVPAPEALCRHPQYPPCT
jgi:hypothetical protein